MCTLAFYRRVWKEFPLVIAANRDEHYDRPSTAPAFVGENPRVVAGTDLRGGGTWLGVNSHGLAVGILNRRSTPSEPALQPIRSRGLLCSELLQLEGARAARSMLAVHERHLYRPFVLLCADREHAWIARNNGAEIASVELGAGLHVFSNSGEFPGSSGKIARARLLFANAVDGRKCAPASAAGYVPTLYGALRDHVGDTGDPADAICVHGKAAGTVSSSILVYSEPAKEFYTFYCPGAPCRHTFHHTTVLPVE